MPIKSGVSRFIQNGFCVTLLRLTVVFAKKTKLVVSFVIIRLMVDIAGKVTVQKTKLIETMP